MEIPSKNSLFQTWRQCSTDCDILRQTRSPGAEASRSLRAVPPAFCKIPLRGCSWGSWQRRAGTLMPLESVVLNIQSMQRKRWRCPRLSCLLPPKKKSSLGRSDPQTLSGIISSLSTGKNIQKEVGFPYPAWIILTGEEQIPNLYSSGLLQKHLCWRTHQNQL